MVKFHVVFAFVTDDPAVSDDDRLAATTARLAGRTSELVLTEPAVFGKLEDGSKSALRRHIRASYG